MFLNRNRGLASERRDSNPRPRPWQGRALPAELLSLKFLFNFLKNFFLQLKKKLQLITSLKTIVLYLPIAIGRATLAFFLQSTTPY